MPQFCGGRAYIGRYVLSTTIVLCALLLSGCGESPGGYSGSPTTSSDTLQPIVAPPGADQGPPLPGTTGAQKTADGLPMLGSMGVNTALFATKISDENERMSRLENAVQELRNDFDAVSPAIARLVSIEGDIQGLVSQLEVMTGKNPDGSVAPIDENQLSVTEPVQPAPVPAPPSADAATDQQTTSMDSERSGVDAPMQIQPQVPAQETAAAPVSGTPAPETAPAPPTASVTPPVAAQAAPAASASIAVQAIRIGEHPGKVRIVLDVKGKTTFTADLDNQEKILVVELPKAAWNAAAQQSYNGNPVLASYSTEALSNGGTRVIIKLKAGTSIAYKSVMDDAATGGSKVVIDLTSK